MAPGAKGVNNFTKESFFRGPAKGRGKSDNLKVFERGGFGERTFFKKSSPQKKKGIL
jgi:hypothetical protein